MTLRFISHSGAVAGEPNAHELIGASGRLLLDCGGGMRGAPYIEQLQKPSAVWISHAHHDHCGGVFELLSRWPRTVVLATAKTAKLLRFALESGSGRSRGGSSRVEALCRRITTVPWRRFRDVPRMKGVQIMALEAGHVPGAAMAVVQWGDGTSQQRVLYTGDFCTHDQAVVGGAGIPRRDGGFSMDAVISEAMLANDRQADEVVWTQQAQHLVDAVGRDQGPAIVGVGAIGESLEVAAVLGRAGMRVMVDEYLRPVFDICSDDLDGTRQMLSFGGRRRLKGHLRARGVVVATGDQYRRATTAGVLVEQLVDDPQATIAVLNRARSNTEAGQLLATDKGGEMKWRGRVVRRRAKVVYCRMINHAPRWQLEGFIRGVGAEKSFLVHGPTGSRWGLKRWLHKKGYTGDVEVVEQGEEYEIPTK